MTNDKELSELLTHRRNLEIKLLRVVRSLEVLEAQATKTRATERVQLQQQIRSEQVKRTQLEVQLTKLNDMLGQIDPALIASEPAFPASQATSETPHYDSRGANGDPSASQTSTQSEKVTDNPEAKISKLIKSLFSAEAQNRVEAALALGGLGDENAIPALSHVLTTDPNPEVRRMAAEALGMIGSQEEKAARGW